jgi:hypothetical protein
MMPKRADPARPRRADVADGYDRGADAYEALWSPVILPSAAAVVRNLALTGRCVVADVGAGPGALLSVIRSAAPEARVIALDASLACSTAPAPAPAPAAARPPSAVGTSPDPQGAREARNRRSAVHRLGDHACCGHRSGTRGTHAREQTRKRDRRLTMAGRGTAAGHLTTSTDPRHAQNNPPYLRRFQSCQNAPLSPNPPHKS